MLGWVVGGVATFVVSLVFACVFLQLRCRGIGLPFGPHARSWALLVVLATAILSTGLGLLIVAVSHETSAALAGLVVPGGLWLTNVGPPRDRLQAGWLTRPLSHLYDAMGGDMQAWCDVRHRAATEEPQWISAAAKYYYDQVKGRIKDRRALEELCDWRDSIVHKINIVRLINLDTTPARLHDALQKHPVTQNLRRYADDDLPRLARRLESDATNELDLFLACVYRLGYHKLLIYPFRPSVHRSPRATAEIGESQQRSEDRPTTSTPRSVPPAREDANEEFYKNRADRAGGTGPSGHQEEAIRVGDSQAGKSPGDTGSGGGGGGSGGRGPEGPELPSVRYLTGDLPERAPVGRRISLLVRIALAKPDSTSAPLKRLNVPTQGCEVTITVSAPALVALGDLEQDLHVPAAADSEPIRFSFTTGRAGLHPVLIRAFAGGTFLGELALQISVEVGATLEEGPIRAAAMAGLVAEPGEVTLQVSRTDEDRYSFQLIAEALYPVELTKRLAGDPTEVVGALVDELRAIAARTSPFTSPTMVRNRIKNLGAQLWADVVPDAIRQQFWAQADRIKLFTVASDMDTVPWELLYPVDGGNDNGFLVEQFPVVRRVYGQSRVRRLPLASAAYIVPPGSPDNAMDEVQAVRSRLGADIRDQGVVGRLDSLVALLDDSPSVLHFSCHNQFTDQRGSVITLEGGPLRPSDLAVAVQTHGLATASPLVFFNACRTAGEIPGLMQMMGWAKQFMGAGAGAFLGSSWAVRSSSARAFADAFYQALVTERMPLGDASLLARQAIRGDDGDPTWLAYTVYGNPSAAIEREART